MNKALFLALLMTAAFAGSLYKSNRIILEKDKDNVIDFACGQQDGQGTGNILNRNYIYSFTNLPSWLRYSNGRITGRPPKNVAGPWVVNANYQGNTAANRN
jgi:hypothetical protein